MTERDVIGALNEQAVVALTLYGEARNEPIEGIVAVACVIRNRMRTHYRGQTYREVCLAPWQFSCWKKEGGAANHAAVLALAASILNEQPIEDAAFRECAWVADGVRLDTLRDRVGRSRHYHAAALTPLPKWAVGQIPAYRIHHHWFYEGVA